MIRRPPRSTRSEFYSPTIFTTDGSPLPILRFGKTLATDAGGNQFLLSDVLHVPTATRNLLSIYRFCSDNNLSVNFNATKVQVWNPTTKQVLAEGRATKGLYELPLNLGGGVAFTCEAESHFLWHCRLGHLNSKAMSVIINNGSILSDQNKNISCDSCFAGKAHVSPHPSQKTSYKPLDLVFADIWGPSPVLSTTGNSYYINFVDVGTNFNCVHPICHKSKIGDVFDKFRVWAERQCGRKLLAVQTDNAREFQKLGKKLAELGISHRMSAPYSHQQMGFVEWRH